MSRDQLEEITQKKIAKRNKNLEEYNLKGFILKKLGEDIQQLLPSIVTGLVAEVVSDGNVIVVQLDRSGKEVKGGESNPIPSVERRDGDGTSR